MTDHKAPSGNVNGLPHADRRGTAGEATVPDWTTVAAQALDSLPSRIAVVDASGTIAAVNRAWRTFAHLHGASDVAACEGRNIFEVCAAATGEQDQSAASRVAEGLRKVLDGTIAIHEDEQKLHAEDGRYWIGVRISALRVAGKPMAVVAYEDITERKRIESALRDAELALEHAQEIAKVGSWMADFATGMLMPSPEVTRLASWEPGAVPLERLGLLVHPDDRETQAAAWAEAMRTGAYDLEHRMLTRAGVVWVHVQAEFTFDSAGRPRQAFGIAQDITDQRRMLDAAAEERARLRTVLDAIPDMMFVKDVEGRYVACNPAVETFLGVPEAEIVGKTDADFLPPDIAAALRADDQLVCRKGGVMRKEESFQAGNGRSLFVETVKTPIYFRDELIGVLGISRDIKEQRWMTQALASSEQLKEFALDAGQFGSWHHRSGSPLVTIDRRAQRLWDVDVAEMDFAELVSERVHPDDRGIILQAPRAPGRHTLEFRVRHRDGSEHWLLSYVHISGEKTDDGHQTFSSHGTVQDITERKRAEATMVRFVSATPVVLYALAIEPDGSFPLRWLSGNLPSMTGWTDEQARGRHWWVDNVHPEDRAMVFAANAQPLVTGHWIQEFRFRRADSRYIWVRDEKRLLRDSEGRPSEIVGSWSDITQRVELEDRLRQAHKLEAIGLLAGGIAHDFNNLLTVIGGNSELLVPFVNGVEATRLLGEIRDAGERAGALTRQLLAFSRSQVLAPRVFAVNDIVHRNDAILTRLIGENITCEWDLARDAGHVRVDASQFDQVLLNLAVNARDAMPAGGRLVIRTERVWLDDEYATRHPGASAGPYVCISVADTGVGMTTEVKTRLFEPFFTTKEPGRGTGLGLPMAFGIVTQSGGHIDVDSRPGDGATFHIYLPLVEAPAVADAYPTSEVPIRRAHEAVLLVEDEASVRKLARLALERAGYTVLVAENGVAALDLADRHNGPIDVLLTDVVMPEMGGTELAHAMLTRRPGLKVIFMSGYVQDALERADLSGANFILKPFTLKELSDRVRAVLDASA